MNVCIYLFGRLGHSYMQYPNDYTHEIFAKFENNIQSQKQMMIHRQDYLMYYGYLLKLSENDEYVGISFVFNDVMCTDVARLWKFCEDSITHWVVKGDILKFADNGDIVSNVNQFHNKVSDLKKLSEELFVQIASAGLRFAKLPPANYAISTNAIKTFYMQDSDNSVINTAQNEYCNIYIYSDAVFVTRNSYSDKLHRLYTENIELKNQNAEILRRKKRTTIVTILLIVIAVGVILFLLTIQSKNDDIGNLAKSNAQLTTHVKSLQKDSCQLVVDSCRLAADLQRVNDKLRISDNRLNALRADSTQFVRRLDSCYTAISALRVEMENAVSQEHAKAAKAESEFETFKNSIASNPFYVYDIEIGNKYAGSDKMETDYGERIYSSHTMYLSPKIKYVGIIPDTYLLKVKLYNQNGTLQKGKSSPEDCTYTHSVSLSTGKSEAIVGSWGNKTKGTWRSGSYRMEIWYDSTCLFSKTFTIY